MVIALLCTAASLWLNVQVAPAAQEEMRSTVFNLATRNPMALFGSDQVIDQFPGRKIYVGKKDGNKLENIIVFETNDESMPMRVTYARTGSLEADLPNKRILMHLFAARYQQRDEYDPFDLNRMRDGISVAEGTLPISLEELYEKEKRRASRSMLSLEQLLEQLNNDDPKMRSSSRTEINKRFSFPWRALSSPWSASRWASPRIGARPPLVSPRASSSASFIFSSSSSPTRCVQTRNFILSFLSGSRTCSFSCSGSGCSGG